MPSMSLEGFIEFLGEAAERAHKNHEALERAAVIVETEAKAELGNYQAAAGPFAAWEQLHDRTLETNTANTPGLVTGEMRDSIGHEANDEEAVIGSNDTRT